MGESWRARAPERRGFFEAQSIGIATLEEDGMVAYETQAHWPHAKGLGLRLHKHQTLAYRRCRNAFAILWFFSVEPQNRHDTTKIELTQSLKEALKFFRLPSD